MDFNQNSPLQNPPEAKIAYPLAGDKKGKKNLIVGLIVLVIIIIVALILVVNYKGSDKMSVPGLTEEERRAIVYSLEKTAAEAPKITEEERRAVIYSLQETSKAAPALTPAERQDILKSLAQ
ncbi:MAG: hypothetical protein WCV68_02275 [Candidatus Paceibacterota bacterium]|jgi:flagellar basal body-associated protein FliL